MTARYTDEQIMSMSDAELRELCAEADEAIAPIAKAVETDPAGRGVVQCPWCKASAPWRRDGSDWSIKCSVCEWGAVGYIRRLNCQ